MPRSIFGWSYPPGCSGVPEDYQGPCSCCGKASDDCICPECPTCETFGDPECYKNHGLTYTQEQLDGQAALAEMYRRQAEQDRKWAHEQTLSARGRRRERGKVKAERRKAEAEAMQRAEANYAQELAAQVKEERPRVCGNCGTIGVCFECGGCHDCENLDHDCNPISLSPSPICSWKHWK